jgi:hypothetical protein
MLFAVEKLRMLRRTEVCMRRTGIMRIGGIVALVFGARLAAAADSAPLAGGANVFAEALELGQDIRSQREAIERKVSDPAVTSPEIAAARRKVDALTLSWSGGGTDAEKADTLKRLREAQQALRDLVRTHPNVAQAVQALEADQAKLRILQEKIAAIRAANKRKLEQAVPAADPAVKAE